MGTLKQNIIQHEGMEPCVICLEEDSKPGTIFPCCRKRIHPPCYRELRSFSRHKTCPHCRSPFTRAFHAACLAAEQQELIGQNGATSSGTFYDRQRQIQTGALIRDGKNTVKAAMKTILRYDFALL